MKCAWIENMLSVETDGWTRPCCLETSEQARISLIKDGIKNAFNNRKLIQLQSDLSHGYSEKTRFACTRCEQLELRNQESMRTSTPFVSETRELKVLQFKMSNKCQLACAHCGPDRSSTWRKILNIQPRVLDAFTVTDEFLLELADILPNLTTIKFTGGEPFLDPNHWKILEFLTSYDRSHCKLFYITNGLVKPKTELWNGWLNVDCSVSADGYEDTFNWFRRGANWIELVDAVHILSQKSNVSINYGITPYTVCSLDKAKNFWKYKIDTYQVVWPKYSSLLDFPKKYLDNDSSFYSAGNDNGNINFYRQWAMTWDQRWGTVGWANKLFSWMNDDTC